MSVEFNEDNGFGGRKDFGGADQQIPKMAAWLISKGVAKDVSGANKIQVAVSLLFFATAIYFFLK